MSGTPVLRRLIAVQWCVLAVLTAVWVLRDPPEPVGAPNSTNSDRPTARPAPRASRAEAARRNPARPSLPGDPRHEVVDPREQQLIGTVLHGRVLDPTGHPVLGAGIYARPASETGGTLYLEVEQRQAHGYALLGLQPGTWTIGASASGMHRVEIEAFEIPPGTRRIAQNFLLEPASRIQVVLTAPDGRRIPATPGALGIAEHWSVDDPLPLHVLVMSEPPRGAFLPANPPLPFSREANWDRRAGEADGFGILEVVGDFPLHAVLLLRDRIVDRQVLRAPTPQLAFRLPAGGLATLFTRLEIQVRDADTGEPVAGAEVRIDWHRGKVTTDSQGVASFGPRPCGLTVLRVEPGSRYLPLRDRRLVERGDDGSTRLAVEVAPRGDPLLLHCADPQGLPLADAEVFVATAAQLAQAPHTWVREHPDHRSDDDGLIRIPRARSATEPLHLFATHTRGASPLSGWLTTSPDQREGRLTLATAVQVTFHTWNPAERQLVVRDRDGACRAWFATRYRQVQALLPATAYELEIHGFDGLLERRSLEVVTGPLRIEIP